MAGDLRLYLFGDQTFDVQSSLKDLLQHRNNPVLEDLLVRSYNALRQEIHSLPRSQRDRLPRFTCIDDIILRKAGPRCLPLDMAVTCLYHIAVFVIELDTRHFIHESSRLLGLCTGALAAAAISCSHSALDLVPAAVDAVTVAFRVGKFVAETADRVEPSIDHSDNDDAWSMIVPGRKAGETAVRAFCDETSLPITSRPYVSAHLPNGITVSGPPSSLARLAGSPSFAKLRPQRIPIYAPYHAPHLYTRDDVHEIVQGVVAPEVGARLQQIFVFSCTRDVDSTRKSDFTTALKTAVEQILLSPIRWDRIMRDVQDWLLHETVDSFTITPFATRAEQIIHSALQQTSLKDLMTPPPLLPAMSRSSSCDSTHSSGGQGKAKLAIIGMSGRFPGAKDNEAFWDLLYRGLDVHKPVPALHWNEKTHVDPTGAKKNTSATPFGCWLDDPDDFDARFFNISPREAPQIDPAQRLALMTAYEAIEQAGIVPDATPSTRRDRVGVFYGVTSNDWMETNSAQDIDTYFIPGGNRAFIPGRINYCFKFSGPSYAVDTACSSSLAGIHIACNALWRGDIDTAIAGGTNVLTNPDFTAGLDRGHFLSRTGNCKTFDDEADGYCRGEGIGTVIIKRLDDAIADNDPILGTILGAYTNHSAEAESITRPHVGAQREIFTKILNQAAVDPYTVGYVEMHGTGTQAGDAGEMASVLHTFAPPLADVKEPRSDAEALYLGSAKANIGHGEAASGVSSLVKVLLMMQKNVIVPHCGIKSKINHKFPTDLQDRNVHIAFKPIPWRRDADPSKPRRAFVNNFSAAGGNSALLLEDVPLPDRSGSVDAAVDSRSHHVVAVSAKSAVSLQGNLKSLLTHLRSEDVALDKLSYTTTVRRQHHPHRVMVTGSSIEDVCVQLEKAIRNEAGAKRPKSAPKIIFAFTGQGAQYAGMGRQLFESFSLVRAELQRLDRIGQSLGFPSFLPVILSEERDCADLAPVIVQLASASLQIALGKLWASWNIKPTAVVGHSLGEYAALNAAGVLSETDMLYLVGKRAELLQNKCTKGTHSMLVVRGSVEQVGGILKGKQYEIACINSPVETVLAGPVQEISEFKSLLADADMKSTTLQVPYAFHSSQVEPILQDFLRVAEGVSFSQPTIPILCPSDGSVVFDGTEGAFSAQFLADQCRQPVNMQSALLEGQRSGIVTDEHSIVEIGPHPAVSAMFRSVIGSQTTTLASCQRGKAAFQVLAGSLSTLYTRGADINWHAYHTDFKASHDVVSLPAYSWDLKKYWIQYVNDWSPRKGDPPLVISNGPSTLESTTIHSIIEESEKKLTVEANIARKDLSPLVQGHEVDGIPLCTPSVYCDMALSMGTYLLKKHRPDQKETLVDVSNMEVSKALILKPDVAEQPLRACGEIDWTKDAALIKFMSFDNKQKLQEHARCTIRFRDRSQQRKLQDMAATIKEKMQALRKGIALEETARFNRPMVYRAIRPLARFHDDYRAINEIVLNSSTLEASSNLSYGSVRRGGTYHTHPAIIDSMTQSCGFTMNCNDGCDLDKEVFMNHGWGNFQMYEPMDFDKTYTTYTQMSEGEDKLWHGDVTIFDGERVVAWFGQIAIQGVPRRVLKVILNIEAGNKKQSTPAGKTMPAPKKSTAVEVSPPAVPTAAVSSESSVSGKFARALEIIADESGLGLEDLTDTTCFADVGIDSLMCLGICARFNEEIDIEFEFSAFLTEIPSVKHLRAYIGGPEGRNNSIGSAVTSVASGSPHGSGTSTPRTIVDDRDQDGQKVDFEKVLGIITDESGLAAEDLSNDTNFGDAGVDSLLSLVIVSRMRDELELDVQHESLLVDCPTVGDLRTMLLGEPQLKLASKTSYAEKEGRLSITTEEEDEAVEVSEELPALPAQSVSDGEQAELASRKAAVDSLVEKYTAGFSAPMACAPPPTPATRDISKVVLVTGATGSLGSHLVDQLAQMDDIETVVCLNREKSNVDPYQRQQKAMREKGHRSFDKIRSKLLVLQTDSSQPRLGLSSSQYEELASSVTHLIHQAWPMSAKRGLAGFEPQFQVMRNLIDFARDASSRRDPSFRFTFQMVSSVGVVGRYGLDNKCDNNGGEEIAGTDARITVPEDRVSIETVLPNGYSEAKWGCERMLDATLHRHPARFRPMVVRLGQIAGCKVKGYWNPMEHFGFLIKSSQTLNALPDVPGDVFWTPVNDIAGTLADLILLPPPPPSPSPSPSSPRPREQQQQQHQGTVTTTADAVAEPCIFHIENPVGQPWRQVNGWLADSLGIPRENMVPFEEWVERVRQAPGRGNPASTLLHFLDSNYLRMSCGGLVLGTRRALEASPTLRRVGPVGEEVVRRYVHIWREIGFLS